MEEQMMVLKNISCFDPVHIFECGQCFRWNQQQDGSYIGIVRQNVIQVRKVNNTISITSMGKDPLEKLCQEYFDLTTDYDQMKQILSTIDDYLAQSVTFGQGIRILKQDVWETLISFIISANNNIPRIKGIIERLSAYYGTKIEWNGVSYYTFPTPEQLSRATIPDLRKLGLGFRDKRVYQTTQMVQNKTLNLEQLQKEGDLQQLRTTLLQVPGVGPKVADCVLLFGFQKREVFPVDVWVRRVMNEIYLHETEEEKVTKEKIQQIARQKYGNLAGIAQQYLFYWEREKSKVS